MDGDLSDSESTNIERELQSSEDLQRELESLRRAREWIRNYPGREPSESVWENFLGETLGAEHEPDAGRGTVVRRGPFAWLAGLRWQAGPALARAWVAVLITLAVGGMGRSVFLQMRTNELKDILQYLRSEGVFSMAKSILAMAAVALLTMPLTAQDSSRAARDTKPATVADELTVVEMFTDFDVLRGALEEAHGGLYRFSSKEAIDRHFDAYRRQINRPMTRVAFIGLVSEMLAAVRDGHMRMQYDEATVAALTSVPLFPLEGRIEGSRLMVLSNDTPEDSTIRPGMEILRINGRLATDVLTLILPKLAGDGFIETGKRRRLGRSFAQSYWLFVDQGSEFTVTARQATGQTVTTTLAGVQNADRDRSSNPVNRQIAANLTLLDGPEDRVSLQFIADPDIARLRIRGFGGQQFPTSIETAFHTLRDKGTRVLILDLRGNGGGVDEYGALLVSHFTDRPFHYFDRIHVKTIHPSFTTWVPRTYEDLRTGTVPDPAGGYLVTSQLHPGVAEQQPATVPFLGTVFVLIDGGTFSTAADVSAQLHHLNRATFIGEETGGTYEGNTSGLNAVVTLPKSGLSVKVMMYGYWSAVASDGRGRGTQPDYPVDQRVADVLSGVDAPLERAIALARAAVSGSPD